MERQVQFLPMGVKATKAFMEAIEKWAQSKGIVILKEDDKSETNRTPTSNTARTDDTLLKALRAHNDEVRDGFSKRCQTFKAK